MKTVLVTGAGGFIGRVFVRKATRVFTILSVSHTSHTLPKTDIIVHLAARTAKTNSDATTLSTYRKDNVQGTKKLLRQTHSYFVYVSTLDVLKTPLTPYARSKKEAEQVVRDYCQTHAIPYCIVRLGSVFGPGEGQYGKVIPTLIRAYVHHEQPVVVDAIRRFIYVDDVARQLLDIVKNQKKGIISIEGKNEITIPKLAYRIKRLVAGEMAKDTFERQLRQEIKWFKKNQTMIIDVDGTMVNHRKRQLLTRAAYTTIQARRRHIETPAMLALDTLYPGIKKWLTIQARSYRLVAVSSRQSQKRLIGQMRRLGIAHFFNEIRAVGPVRPKAAKLRAFRQIQDAYHLSPGDITVVGDSAVDEASARALGARFVRATRSRQKINTSV